MEHNARSNVLSVNVYECLLILDPNQYSRDAAKVSGQIGEFVEKQGGEMLVSRLWDERRLAYPINGRRKGTYWLSYFKLESEKLSALERDCQLSDSILRQLCIRIDDRIAEALVSHAQISEKQPAEGEKAATTAPADESKKEEKESGAERADAKV